MKKIRILQFPIANSKGGITHYALNNWKWMDRSKFECDFATMSKRLDYEDEIRAMGSKVFYLSRYAEDDKETFIREFDEILKEGYDVVHLHTKQWKSFLIEEICKSHHIPKVIVHAHSSGIDTLDVVKRKYEEELHEKVKMRFNENLATDFWACSQLAADFLFGEYISKDKIRIMPNAIELDKFAYNQNVRNQYREKYGLENCFIIGHVGRFVYQKNHEFLINVFDAVLKKIRDAKLLLLGDGELMVRAREQAKNLKIEDRIVFLGKRDDISNWYQTMDVFCLPSRFEGLPIALIEAQAAGISCIGSEAISNEAEISNNVIRLPLSVDEWVKWILVCYYERKNVNRIQPIRAEYDIHNQIKVVEKLYEENL